MSAGRSASGSMPAWLISVTRRGEPEARTSLGRPIMKKNFPRLSNAGLSHHQIARALESAPAILRGVQITDALGCRVPSEHDGLSTTINHVMVSLVGDEVPRQGGTALVNTGRVTGRDPLQFLASALAERANKLHVAGLVGQLLRNPLLAIGQRLAPAARLLQHLLLGFHGAETRMAAQPSRVQSQQVLGTLQSKEAIGQGVKRFAVPVLAEVSTGEVGCKSILAQLFYESGTLLKELAMLLSSHGAHPVTDHRHDEWIPIRIVNELRKPAVVHLGEVIVDIIATERVNTDLVGCEILTEQCDNELDVRPDDLAGIVVIDARFQDNDGVLRRMFHRLHASPAIHN